MTGSVLVKKKTLKLGHFPRCSMVYIKQKSKNSHHNDLGVLNTHTQLFNKNLGV
jgi:uncharacterized C2H2 Zn-finger protein